MDMFTYACIVMDLHTYAYIHATLPPCTHTNWVAAKELNISYHIMDIYQIMWFWDSGNLN